MGKLLNHCQVKNYPLAWIVLLAGCVARPEPIHVVWTETSVAELYRICRDDPPPAGRPAFSGCFRRSLDTCYIYTLPREQRSSEHDYHATAGHELRHCRDGYFHGAPRVELPPSAARIF